MSGTAGKAFKDAGNWGAVFGIGAAIADAGIGDATRISATDITGEAIKIGGVGIGVGVIFTGVDILLTAKDKKKLVVNPLFAQHGFDDPDAPATRKYFKWRKAKKIVGSVVSGAGSLGAIYTAVNVGGMARHGRSVANTIEHLVRFQAEARKIPRSKFFQDLVAVMVKCKAIKLVGRTGALVGDAIPGCAIASGAISGLTGIAANVAMSRMDNDDLVASLPARCIGEPSRRRRSSMCSGGSAPGRARPCDSSIGSTTAWRARTASSECSPPSSCANPAAGW